MKYRNILLLFLLCLSLCGWAESGKLLTVENGLSSSLINKLYQAKNGIIWISTEDGLNRYDGVKITVYRHNKEKHFSINDNYVRAFFEDQKGNFFIGTPRGIQLYNEATDHFVSIPFAGNSPMNMDMGINGFLQRRNGELLAYSDAHGIMSITAEKEKVSVYPKNLLNFKITTPIRTVYEDQSQNLWIWIDRQGLYCIRPDKTVRQVINTRTLGTLNYCDICEDLQGNIYIGTLNKGLFIIRRNSYKLSSVEVEGNSKLAISSLCMNKDELYIGTDDSGLKIYDTRNGKLTNSDVSLATFDFQKAKIHTIIKDKRGNTWLGLYQKGVLFLSASINKFNYIGYKSVNRNILGSNAIMSLTKDHAGTLWVGTDNDGLYGIDSAGKRCAHFVHTGNPNSVPSVIMSIYDDSNHTIWLGSFLNGMAKFNPASGQCNYCKNLYNEFAVPVSFVSSFAEDHHKNLWIGTMGDGLFCMNLTTGKITSWNKGRSGRTKDNQLGNLWINALFVSKDNKLYIGTCNGISCLNLNTGDYISGFAKDPWIRNVFYCFYENANGEIWVGSSDGLVCYTPSTGKTVKYTVKDGLPNNIICAIKGDEAGNLWISTSGGLSTFNSKSKNFINYYAADGLQGNEFTKNASFSDKNGIITFGGINGIVYFNPKEINNRVRKPDIYITAFYLHNQAVKKGMKSGAYQIVDSDVMSAREFHLSHNDNSFSIEFSSLEFNDLERISYLYKLNDNNWIALQPGTHLISYSNLSPGTYNLKIKAKDGTSYSDIKEITLIIYPAWYATVWAKICYLLVLAFVVYLFWMQYRHRQRVKKEMMEHVQAEQINEAKLQFFMNISHEIRTPMSLVISPLQKLITTDKDATRQKYYRMIYRSSERILLLINQLLDIRKIDKGQMKLEFQETDLVDFINNLYSTFEYQIQSKQIRSTFQHPDKLMAWIDPKNFDKVIINLLSNAVKFTPPSGEIHIILKREENIEIIVSNTGSRIDEQEMDRIFERFYQIRNSQNNSNIGTGIGLHLTRSIVELHHGTIQVKNDEEGEGCRFIIHIPSGKEHLKQEALSTSSAGKVEIAPMIKEDNFPNDDTTVKSKTKYRILVVEDDEDICTYIRNEFLNEFHVQTCVNGKEALALILKNAPDLVISDVMMPEMDGMTLCKKIKQNININSVPVILLTAKTRDEDNLEGLEVGADAYITKPFNIDILQQTVVNILHSREMLRNCYTGSQEQEKRLPEQELQSVNDKLLDRIMAVINRNLSNPELNVEAIAMEVGLSRVHLYRKLKELTNQSPRDFVRNVRLKQAATMLASKQYNVSETASLTGFTDIAVFSRAFKELYGVSPSVYAKGEHKE